MMRIFSCNPQRRYAVGYLQRTYLPTYAHAMTKRTHSLCLLIIAVHDECTTHTPTHIHTYAYLYTCTLHTPIVCIGLQCLNIRHAYPHNKYVLRCIMTRRRTFP